MELAKKREQKQREKEQAQKYYKKLKEGQGMSQMTQS